MARTITVILLVCLALSLAGSAAAKNDKAEGDDAARGPPAHANAKAIREAAAPPASVPEPLPEEDLVEVVGGSVAAAPEPFAVFSSAADAPLVLASDGAFHATASEAAPSDALASRTTPTPREDIAWPPSVDAVPASAPAQPSTGASLDDVAPLAPATIVSAALPAPGRAAGGDGWLRVLWALPLLGAFGAVVMARRRVAAVRTPTPTDAQNPPTDVPDALSRGYIATQAGDLSRALACFETALRMAPGLGVAHFCRGVCLAAMGRTAEAYAALEESVMDDPADGARRVHLARAALTLGRAKDAMDAIAPLASDAPEIGEALFEDPHLAGLRDHPRFLALCGRL